MQYGSNWTKSESLTSQMRAAEQYFPVMLFTMQYKVVLPFKSVDEVLNIDQSNERYPVVLSCSAVCLYKLGKLKLGI